jgi:hypothetical protein
LKGNKKKFPVELTIVASLIDKPPNIGHLSRTSEVFNLKELVVNFYLFTIFYKVILLLN